MAITELEDKFQRYRSNALPGIVSTLASQLGVSEQSLHRLGIGWKIEDSCWVFPERDSDGRIIGLTRRFRDGKKYCEGGSQRGLTYEATAVLEGYDPSRQQWRRVTDSEPCPICGKPGWCGVDGNTIPPRFVRCMRISKGSVWTDRSEGHIHELVPGTFKSPGSVQSPLARSEFPTLVVEGASDTAAGLTLGFSTVGRPSDKGGLTHATRLLQGRSVAIIGENDRKGDGSFPGRDGMEKTFEVLYPHVSKATKIMPPEGIKDLRDWVRQGLTREQLLRAIDEGDSKRSSDTFDSRAPLPIAEQWLADTQTEQGALILRRYRGMWYRFNGHYYAVVDEKSDIRGGLYTWLKDKKVVRFSAKGDVSIEPYDATRTRVTDIIDALNMSCPLDASPPCWLDGYGGSSRPENLVVFQNGILDTECMFRGNPILWEQTPHLFTLTSVPYDYNPVGAKCPQWLKFLSQIFNSDAERIALLQEWFGYNLVADTSQEKLMLIVGRPGSGKSTTLDVMQAMMGRDHCARSSFKDLCSQFGLQPLVGKLSIILPDAHVPRHVDSMQALEVIKSIVGRDGMTVNRKFLMQIPSCDLVGRFTIAVNELPELPDHARSLERRLCLLHFPNTFEGREDRTLKDRLPKEAPGVAVWALEGLRRLRHTGQFTKPSSSKPVIEEFRQFLTPIAEFINECCEVEVGLNYWVTKEQLYDCWAAWAKARGLRPGVSSRFGQRLLAQLPTIETSRRTITGKQQYVYGGINLTANARDRYLVRGGHS